jgi:hypothetical protein|tara:strand:- start:328 stop:2376 length:2049 start_codon:yes stop_codon:yes gene_type:complete
MSGAKGRTQVLDILQIAGLDGQVWQKTGTSTDNLGVVFSLEGEVVKARGIQPLVPAWRSRSELSSTNTPFNPLVGDSYPVVSLGAFHHHGTTEILLEYGGKIAVLRGDELEIIAENRWVATSPSESSRFLQVGNVVMILNGRDPNIKWDGVKVTPLGINSVPSAPVIAETNPGDGDIPLASADGFWSGQSIKKSGAVDKKFWYKLTYVNEYGQESEPSLPSNMVSDGSTIANKRYMVLVGGLSQEPPSDDITGRFLWRSGDNLTYFRNAFLSGTSADTYWDFVEPGETLTDELPADGTNFAPPLAKWAFEYRGRTYYGGNPETPSILYYSAAAGGKEAVSANNYIVISGVDGSDYITGFGVAGDYGLIFTSRSTHLLTNSKEGEPIMTPISQYIGAVSDKAVVGFEDRIFFFSEAGVFVFDGSKLKPISKEIATRVKELPESFIKNIVGWADPINRRILFAVNSGPGDFNNEIWVIHADTGAVSKIRMSVYDALSYKGETLVAFRYEEATHPRPTYRYDIGMWEAQDSLPMSGSLAGSFDTRWLFGKNPQTDKTYYRLDVFYVQTGDISMNVSWATDWNRDSIGSTTFNLADPDALIWDEALSDGTARKWNSTLDPKTWDEQRVRCKKINITAPDSYPSGSPLTAKSIKFRFETSSSNQPWRIVGFLLHLDEHGVRGEGTDA